MFKKPAWAQAKPSAKPVDLFRRSNQVYSDFVATARDDESSEEDEDREPETKYETNESKRRRISTEEEPTVVSGPEREDQAQLKREMDASLDTGFKSELPRPVTGTTPPRDSHSTRTSPRRPTAKTSPLKAASQPGTIIHLNSESPPPPAARVPPPILIEDDADSDNDGDNDEESDEETAELIRRARERARRAAQAEKDSSTPRSKSTSQFPQSGDSTGNVSNPEATQSPFRRGDADTVVTILITSEIEGTKPLLVRRKLSQNLGDVRKAWCNHQRFDQKISDSVILTWKGRRLFDVTTCKSLGIDDTKNNDNSLFPASDNEPFGVKDGAAGVHMEAMTIESYEAEKRRIAQSLQDPGAESSEDEAKVQAPPSDGDIVRITLKNPGLDDFKIKVRPTTPISNIIKKFREVKGIAEGNPVSLLFDGDRLDPASVVGDNDIDDLDVIDVVLK